MKAMEEAIKKFWPLFDANAQSKYRAADWWGKVQWRFSKKFGQSYYSMDLSGIEAADIKIPDIDTGTLTATGQTIDETRPNGTATGSTGSPGEGIDPDRLQDLQNTSGIGGGQQPAIPTTTETSEAVKRLLDAFENDTLTFDIRIGQYESAVQMLKTLAASGRISAKDAEYGAKRLAEMEAAKKQRLKSVLEQTQVGRELSNAIKPRFTSADLPGNPEGAFATGTAIRNGIASEAEGKGGRTGTFVKVDVVRGDTIEEILDETKKKARTAMAKGGIPGN